MFIILKSKKNIFIQVRNLVKIILLLAIGLLIIAGLISLVYKPTYSVTLNGEFVGYTTNKSKLQKRINEYIENGESDNTAFVDVEVLPEYSLCLLKKEVETNDDEIFDKIKSQGTAYYEYYAIVLDDEEKYYVASKDEAESIIDKLKEKNSSNIDDIAYTQVHSTELKDFTEKDTVVTALYKKKQTVYGTGRSAGGVTVAYSVPDLGIAFTNPTSGTISSRFGARSSGTHTGLDICGPTGTPIRAAASGTVSYVNYSNVSYGNCVKISHGNGVETLYAHMSNIYVTEGQYVGMGELIGTMGSTGNSTGPHLHLEIRSSGSALNPEYYIY